MDRLVGLLDEIHANLQESPTAAIIGRLAERLIPFYQEALDNGSVSHFRETCQSHSLHRLILLDPYSRRAHEKPRGYAGDAVMLDYIYRSTGWSHPSELCKTGFAVHCATTNLPNGKSILWRQAYLAKLIYSTLKYSDAPTVLSIASGHMREIDYLRVLTDDRQFHFTALDQDADSLAVAQSDGAGFNIEVIQKSIAYVIKGGLRGQDYDLVYSAGLFDYLNDKIALALIKAAYALVKPGGVLSIGNFASDNHGRAFMEGFMSWSLVLRSEADIERLLSIGCSNADIAVFRDDPGSVVYGEARRPSA